MLGGFLTPLCAGINLPTRPAGPATLDAGKKVQPGGPVSMRTYPSPVSFNVGGYHHWLQPRVALLWSSFATLWIK